jgi:four helix bundle protein
MSTYNELQVYKITYDLAIHTFTFTEKMKRSFKFTIGEKLNLNAVDLLLNIYKANSRKDERYMHLQAGQEHIEEIRLLLRMSKDLQIMTVNRFVTLNEMVETISKQVYGWQQSVSYQKKPVPTLQKTIF